MSTTRKKQNQNALPELGFVRLSQDAFIPTKGSEEAACYDLYSASLVQIPEYAWRSISTAIAFNIPQGYHVKIYSRSGLGFKQGISLINSVGIIDSDYTGEIKVGLLNNSGYIYTIKPGDRIAQFQLVKNLVYNLKQVNTLRSTDRNTNGFGSSGK